MVSLPRPYPYLPAFIVNFCLKTGPMPARVSPASALRLCSRVMPLPVTGDPALSGLTEITRLAMMPGLTEKETKMSLKSTKKNESTETKNPPADKVRVGLITASIWENETEKGTFHNVTFERRYRDAEGNWKSSHSYNAEDLLSLAKAADLAHTKIVEARNPPTDETQALNDN
jgi:hypothetical protein